MAIIDIIKRVCDENATNYVIFFWLNRFKAETFKYHIFTVLSISCKINRKLLWYKTYIVKLFTFFFSRSDPDQANLSEQYGKIHRKFLFHIFFGHLKRDGLNQINSWVNVSSKAELFLYLSILFGVENWIKHNNLQIDSLKCRRIFATSAMCTHVCVYSYVVSLSIVWI